MRKLFNLWNFVLIFAIVIGLAFGNVPAMADQSKVVLVGGGQAYKPLDDFLLETEMSGLVAGDSWYVDSGKTASGDGKSWDYAVITADEANDLASADNGDVIHVAPGHAETIDSATDWVLDSAGITYIGYGQGAQRPTFTWDDDSDATIPISAADIVFKNMIFDGSSSSSDGPDDVFNVTAAGFQLIGCRVVTGDSTEQATLVITGDANADRMKIIGNTFYGSTDTGTTAAITFTGQAEDIEIAYNTFEGDYSSAAIYSATTITQVNIHHNYIFNYNDDDHTIEFTTVSTGTIAYNQLVTNDYDYAIDAGACDVFETYWADDEVDDVMAVQVLVNEDGAVTWSATQLVVLEAQANEALVDEDLDHLVIASAGTAAYPTNVLDDSVIGFMMATDLVTSYVRTTDSLEALGTQVSDAQIQSNVTAMLEADYLDELIIAAVASNLYTSVDDDSVLGYILATQYVSNYNRATDSLEAIGTDVVAIEVDTQDIQEMVARSATRTADTLPQTATETIFDVATGPVRVLELVGEVTTVIASTTCTLKISVDPTTGTASDMASILDIQGDLDGSFMTMTGTFGSVLVNNSTGAADGMSVPYIVPIGIITITTNASISGNIAWFIRYEPLAPGATVAANGP